MMSTVVAREEHGLPFLVRVAWFIVVGWHVTLYWILVAWLLNVSIIGLPLGLWMLNRAPIVLTLRAPRNYVVARIEGGQVVGTGYQGVAQHGLLVRLLYFVLIGWWFSLAWSLVAWLLSVSIVGLPLGVWMLNRLPEVTTLMRQ
jgi:uncharacterized membrane protein YccF (DUF307 family)